MCAKNTFIEFLSELQWKICIAPYWTKLVLIQYRLCCSWWWWWVWWWWRWQRSWLWRCWCKHCSSLLRNCTGRNEFEVLTILFGSFKVPLILFSFFIGTCFPTLVCISNFSQNEDILVVCTVAIVQIAFESPFCVFHFSHPKPNHPFCHMRGFL